ncbi:site-specific integrase [bacterium]|nr:site-specific integrase [bacterium]MBU1024402.1 site-specific integrase [bacterium]
MTELITIPNTNTVTESRFPPLSIVGEKFINSLDCADNSVNTYSRQLREFFDWIYYAGKPHNLTAWTRQDILDYKRYLQTEYRIKTPNGKTVPLSPATVSGYLSIVRKLWSWMEQEGVCVNIAKTIKGMKRSQGYKKDTLSITQINDALEVFNLSTMEGLRDYAIFNLMVRTGCRDIEIVRAKVEHLRTLDGHQVLYIHAKGQDSANQYKVLTPEAERPIRAYMDARKKVQPFDDDYLFVSLSKRNFMQGLTTRSVSRIIKTALREIGLDDERLTAHSLRHTAITLAVAGGASLHQAQAMAGHKDPRTTQVYFHNQKRIEEAAEKCINF